MKDKDLIKQKIKKKLGTRSRARRKKYLHLKNTGQYKAKIIQKSGVKVKTIPEVPVIKQIIPQLSWWEKIINFIQKIFK